MDISIQRESVELNPMVMCNFLISLSLQSMVLIYYDLWGMSCMCNIPLLYVYIVK